MAVIWILEDEPVLEARKSFEPRSSASIPAFDEESPNVCRLLPFPVVENLNGFAVLSEPSMAQCCRDSWVPIQDR
jgi:hypothetical protein